METKIRLDIEINKRCLEEDIPELVRRVLLLWIEYDYELLELLKEDNNG